MFKVGRSGGGISISIHGDTTGITRNAAGLWRLFEMLAPISKSSHAGSITTTLGALARLIDDYDSMARREMVTAAREKAET